MLIFEGNIMDLFKYPNSNMNLGLTKYLHLFFQSKGYEIIVEYDHIHGFRPVMEQNLDELQDFARITNATTEIHQGAMQLAFAQGEENACLLTEKLLKNELKSSIVIFNMASRYILSANQLQQFQSDGFVTIQMAVSAAKEVYVEDHYNRNLCIFLVDKVNDLPVWFFKDNPYSKLLNVQTPSREERLEFVNEQGLKDFFARDIYEREIPEFEKNPMELQKIKERFVALTEGFTRLELCDLCTMCENERYSIHEMSKIVDLYRYGVKENPWSSIELKVRLKEAEQLLKNRVKGQDIAMDRTLKVIKRAVAGLSGLQHSSHGKPKGILFFAGPTGTGKTEMAKSLAELLFGDERSCIRFDMSEYADESSNQRLLGAAPGYIGYEAGGQLTNAVKEHPFSILLFDEIEKAHKSIMDKFLQILEDGRMTDGQGNTVYFSECVIIFTSNLGIYDLNEYTGVRTLRVSANDSYEQVERKVKEGISKYFKVQLGRPEILNRIGENIIVFDFIREETAKIIMNSQLDKIIRTLKLENNVELTIEPQVRNDLYKRIRSNLENGGRGVGNVIEEVILNPLSSYLLDHDLLNEARVRIYDMDSSVVPMTINMDGSRI